MLYLDSPQATSSSYNTQPSHILYCKAIVETLQLDMYLSQVFGINVTECEVSSKAKVYLLTNTLEIGDELVRYVAYMQIEFIALVVGLTLTFIVNQVSLVIDIVYF